MIKEYFLDEEPDLRKEKEITIKCGCGNVVTEGAVFSGKRRGLKKYVRNIFYLDVERIPKLSGEIRKNKSNNPNDWIGVCSECQKKKK